MSDCMALAEVDVSPESLYSRSTPLAHRKQYGQFFTPEKVAAFMARWVCAGTPRSVLDPAYGLGVFHRHVQHYCTNAGLEYVGYEKDPHVLSHLPTVPGAGRLHIVQEDYLGAGFRQFDAIICNPPYLQFQKFVDRHRVLQDLETSTGERLGGCSNMAAAFLLKALHQLAPDGRLAFLSPMEFFNTRYGTALRTRLVESGLLKHILILPDSAEMFPQAVTSVAVILCHRDGKPDDVTWRQIADFSELQDPLTECVTAQNSLSAAALLCGHKWSTLLRTETVQPAASAGFVPMRQHGRFLRGIATGANKFFVGSRRRFAAHGLGVEKLLPCISRSAQVDGVLFDDGRFDLLDDADKPVWCLNVRDPEPQAVATYLARGVEDGFHQRYLTRMRSPWYRLEERATAPLWVGTFYRGALKVVRNRSQARTLTCFHAFYPADDCADLVDGIFVYLLSSQGQAQVRLQRSLYAAGLEKVEPGDLNRTLCPPSALLRRISANKLQAVLDLAGIDATRCRAAATEVMADLLETDKSTSGGLAGG